MPIPLSDDGAPPEAETELLVERARAGDAEAVGALFRRYGGTLYRLAYRLLGSREDAEDVVQDVFVGLRVSLSRYESRGAFSAWLRRVAARVALMRLRADRRRPHPAADPEDARDDPDLALRLTVERALDTLPEPLRAVLVLRMVEGYAHEEIAAALGITVGASKVRLHRATRRLQQVLRGSL